MKILHSLILLISLFLPVSLSPSPISPLLSPLSYFIIYPHTPQTVCATDAQTNSSLVVTTAFFNEPVQIYIKMIAEPPPRVTMDAFLTYSTSSQIINDMFVSVPNNGEGAEWLWQFIILVPDLSMEVERAKLMFSVNFMQENTTCSPVSVSNNNNEIPEIPVFHRTGAL